MKPAGLALWKVFGTTNQLLAGLSLLVVFIYLLKSKRPTLSILIQCVLCYVLLYGYGREFSRIYKWTYHLNYLLAAGKFNSLNSLVLVEGFLV